jgi:phosphomannomutase
VAVNQVDPGELLQRARAWAAQDPDPRTQRELLALMEAEDHAELAERMAGDLTFGTAGLRGLRGAGSARMNRAVVIRTTCAVVDTLLANHPHARSAPVVLGYDCRRDSQELAEAAASVLVAAGLPLQAFDRPVPTPLVGYAVRKRGASAGVVITASHNPPEYNGYKLFDSTGAQIAPPTDEWIAARIAQVGPACDVPRARDALVPGGPTELLGDELFEQYLDELMEYRPRAEADRGLELVYTPLHGVNWRYVDRAFARAGYGRVHVVAEQAEPNGEFPTTPVPNPEDPSALVLATSRAREVGADLILANDPDGDRLAVSVPTSEGGWAPLSGNQIGLLLADFLLQHCSSAARPLVVSTVVSSPMLDAVATAHGAAVEWTLTGFKWIARAGATREERESLRFLFGYEEAIGYAFGPLVRDKDGISAAVLFADLAAHCRARKESVRDRLDALYRKHGLWVSTQLSIECVGTRGAKQIADAMRRLRARPPSTLGARKVVHVIDYMQPAEDGPAWRPAADLVELGLAAGGSVRVRPSGTEPKLKIYIDLRISVATEQSVRQREHAGLAEATAMLSEVAAGLGFA